MRESRHGSVLGICTDTKGESQGEAKVKVKVCESPCKRNGGTGPWVTNFGMIKTDPGLFMWKQLVTGGTRKIRNPLVNLHTSGFSN